MIPSSALFDQSVIHHLLAHDPVVLDYRSFFSGLDWSVVDRWQAQRSPRGRPAHPEHAYLKAFLLRLREGMTSTSQLRRFLVKHPLLVLELGFHLIFDEQAPYGFIPEKTVPCEVRLRSKLRTFDPALLHALLASTVSALHDEIPGLSDIVAFDVKHIYAWVKENNMRTSVEDRFEKEKRLAGDPDCRLGVKRSTNGEHADGTTSVQKEMNWGYGSGVAATTVAGYGDVILAEWTQPFNRNDITYFCTLHQNATHALGVPPTNITADAAYDAWYVHETVAHHGGMAAVPLNNHGHDKVRYDHDAVPICEKGLRMIPVFQFAHTSGYRAQQFVCPLLYPQSNGDTCEHAQFVKGIGCRKNSNWEAGARARVTLDRGSLLYKLLYMQRTSCERINSQAKELGIERPKLRNQRSISNINTLISVIINVRALYRAKSINRGLLQKNEFRPSLKEEALEGLKLQTPFPTMRTSELQGCTHWQARYELVRRTLLTVIQ